MTDRTAWRLLRLGLLLVDAVMLISAFIIAFALRYRLGWFAVRDVTPDEHHSVIAGSAGLLVWLTAFLVMGQYRSDRLLRGTREYSRLVQACLVAFAFAAVLSSMASAAPYVSRGVLTAALPLTIVLAGCGRFMVRRVAHRMRRRGLFITRAVLIGAGDDGVSIAHQLDVPAHSGVEVVGFLDDFLPAGTLVDGRWTVLGSPSTLDRLTVDEAIVVPSALTWESHFELMQRLAAGKPGPTIRLAPSFFELFATGINVVDRGNVPVVTAAPSRITGVDAITKRLVESVFAMALLVICLPGLLVWAVRQWLPGRAILRHQRFYGARGRAVTGATLAVNPESATPGRLLEKAPLLVGVICGRLALVGPRLTDVTGDAHAAGRTALLSVRPGLTGPASVYLPDGPEDQVLALELRYVRDYSIWRDLQIMWHRSWQIARDAIHRHQPLMSGTPRTAGAGDSAPVRPTTVEAP